MSLPFSFVQSGNGATSASTPVTSGAITTTSHNFLVAIVSANQTGTLSITDNKNNVWRQVGTSQLDPGGINTIGLFFATNITGGSGHTVSGATTGSIPNMAIIVQEFTGPATSGAFDIRAQANGTGASASSGATLVTNFTQELVIGAGSDGGGSGLTVGAGYSNLTTKADGGSSNFLGMQSKIITTTGTQTSTMTVGSGGNWTQFVATFRPGTSTLATKIKPHPFSPGMAR